MELVLLTAWWSLVCLFTNAQSSSNIAPPPLHCTSLLQCIPKEKQKLVIKECNTRLCACWPALVKEGSVSVTVQNGSSSLYFSGSDCFDLITKFPWHSLLWRRAQRGKLKAEFHVSLFDSGQQRNQSLVGNSKRWAKEKVYKNKSGRRHQWIRTGWLWEAEMKWAAVQGGKGRKGGKEIMMRWCSMESSVKGTASRGMGPCGR